MTEPARELFPLTHRAAIDQPARPAGAGASNLPVTARDALPCRAALTKPTLWKQSRLLAARCAQRCQDPAWVPTGRRLPDRLHAPGNAEARTGTPRSSGSAGTATQHAGSGSLHAEGEGATTHTCCRHPKPALGKLLLGHRNAEKTQHFIKALLPSLLRLSPPQLRNHHLPSQDRNCHRALENCKILHFSSKSPPRDWGRFPGLPFYPSAGAMLIKGKREEAKQRAHLVHASLQLSVLTPLSSQASAHQTQHRTLRQAAQKAKPREPERPLPRCPAAHAHRPSQNPGLKASQRASASPSQAPRSAPVPASSSVPGSAVLPAHSMAAARLLPGVAGSIALLAALVGAAGDLCRGTLGLDPALEKSICPHAYSQRPRRRDPSPTARPRRGTGPCPLLPGALRSKADGCSPVPIRHWGPTAAARAMSWACSGCGSTPHTQHARESVSLALSDL